MKRTQCNKKKINFFFFFFCSFYDLRFVSLLRNWRKRKHKIENKRIQLNWLLSHDFSALLVIQIAIIFFVTNEKKKRVKFSYIWYLWLQLKWLGKMGIIEKIKEIEAEMARTQKNKATGTVNWMLYSLLIGNFHLGMLYLCFTVSIFNS